MEIDRNLPDEIWNENEQHGPAAQVANTPDLEDGANGLPEPRKLHPPEGGGP
jgi:hypothetical protein